MADSVRFEQHSKKQTKFFHLKRATSLLTMKHLARNYRNIRTQESTSFGFYANSPLECLIIIITSPLIGTLYTNCMRYHFLYVSLKAANVHNF